MATGVSLTTAYQIHVDAVGDGPRVLEVVFDALLERVGDLVEADELLHSHNVSVVARRARVQALDNCTDISKNTGVHERCNVKMFKLSTQLEN